MPFGVYRGADARVILSLERIDDPAVEMQLIRRFLRTQSATFALSLEPRPDRCDESTHRSIPERIICACSELGNSVCTRRAKPAAVVASPSLRSARNPSQRISGVAGFTAR